MSYKILCLMRPERKDYEPDFCKEMVKSISNLYRLGCSKFSGNS